MTIDPTPAIAPPIDPTDAERKAKRSAAAKKAAATRAAKKAAAHVTPPIVQPIDPATELAAWKEAAAASSSPAIAAHVKALEAETPEWLTRSLAESTAATKHSADLFQTAVKRAAYQVRTAIENLPMITALEILRSAADELAKQIATD